MKIHEYQAKEILKAFDIPIQDGVAIDKINEAEKAIDEVAKKLHASQFVVKAQIHAGGRGKGGGVKFSPDKKTALENVKKILGMKLVTHQTGREGQPVRKVMITEALNIDKEFYVAITLDRAKGKDVFMVSKEGGVEIETVAEKNPAAIYKVWIEPPFGLLGFQARALARALGFKGQLLKSGVRFFTQLYKAYQSKDASIAEINPLVQTKEGELIALDAKFNFDDNALYRQKTIVAFRDRNEEDPSEIEAGQYHLNYIKLDGHVGCMVNGAGLAMATMDIIKLQGGRPANFLDVGGGANMETVKNGFRIILSDPNVKSVLINVFGGIVRCDRVANGIVAAIKELDLSVPVVVRLQGTNAAAARDILTHAGVNIVAAETLDEAAQKAVKAAKA